jgi:hypothetical protein
MTLQVVPWASLAVFSGGSEVGAFKRGVGAPLRRRGTGQEN